MAKDKKNKNKKSFFTKLRAKYRLVVLNEDTYEQKASIRLSRLNLFLIASTGVFFTIVFVTIIIAFTPLKYLMPGVGNLDVRSELMRVEMLADSLEDKVNQRNLWLNHLQQALDGNLDSTFSYSDTAQIEVNSDNINLSEASIVEQDFRSELEDEIELVEIKNNIKPTSPTFLPLKFSKPVEGVIVSEYDKALEHYGVDIATIEFAVVKAVESGMVILTDWSHETGNVIAIQHRNNTISFYKHNKELLKKVGNFVDKGDAIAIVGNTGKLTDGPHLHFEIWQNGKAINPAEIINFETIN